MSPTSGIVSRSLTSDLAELRLQAGTLPWLDYLLEARRLVDRFYPDVEPQPLIALTWSTMPPGYGAPQVSAQPDYNL